MYAVSVVLTLQRRSALKVIALVFSQQSFDHVASNIAKGFVVAFLPSLQAQNILMFVLVRLGSYPKITNRMRRKDVIVVSGYCTIARLPIVHELPLSSSEIECQTRRHSPLRKSGSR